MKNPMKRKYVQSGDPSVEEKAKEERSKSPASNKSSEVLAEAAGGAAVENMTVIKRDLLSEDPHFYDVSNES